MQVSLDSRVLDVGCSSGWATRLLADYALMAASRARTFLTRWLTWPANLRDLTNTDFEVASAERFCRFRITNSPAPFDGVAYYYRNIPKA
jgi:hypothetical protein